MLALRVPGGSKGVGQPQRIVLSDHRVTTLGRKKPDTWTEGADAQFIVLDSPSKPMLTSRSHMKITQRILDSDDADIAFAYTLEDLNSMNGILVNSVRVKTAELKEGDVIEVGNAKTVGYGEMKKKDLNTDLIYVFHADLNAPDEVMTQEEIGRYNSSAALQLLPKVSTPSSTGSLQPSISNIGAPLHRSYSFKPSAKSRRAAAIVAAEGENAMTDDAAASPSRPRVSLAEQLAQAQYSPPPQSAASLSTPSSNSRKRTREEPEETNGSAKSDARQGDEKKQRVELTEEEIARRTAEIEAKTAAAVESAVAAAKSSAAEASKAAASEARQGLATELSEEFQCSICCDLLVHAMALNCSHTFCKSCIAQWLLKGGTSGKGNMTCPQCRQAIESEPVPVKTLDNVIDRIASTSLTKEEQQERKEKLETDAKLVVPKIFEKGKKSKKASAAFVPPPPPPIVPAVAVPGGGFSFGGIRFPFGFGAPAAAAAPAREYEEDEDSEDDDDYDDGEEEDDGSFPVGDSSVSLEHARSGRSTCRGCHSLIGHGEARFAVVSREDRYEYYESTRYWHLRCYAPKVKRRDYPTCTSIPGYSSLKASERATLRALLPDR